MPRQYVAKKNPLLSQSAYEQHAQTYPGTRSDMNLLMDAILMAIQLHTETNQAYYKKSVRNSGYKFS